MQACHWLRHTISIQSNTQTVRQTPKWPNRHDRYNLSSYLFVSPPASVLKLHQRHNHYHRALSQSRSASQCQRSNRHAHYHRPSSLSLHLESAINGVPRHQSDRIGTIVTIFLAQTHPTGTTNTSVLSLNLFPRAVTRQRHAVSIQSTLQT